MSINEPRQQTLFIVVHAHELAASPAVSPDRIRQVWQNLHLTEEFGAKDNAQKSVDALERTVVVNYQRYWQLI